MIDFTDTSTQLMASFYLFFKEFWEVIEPSEKLKENWHIKYLCNELQDMGERIIKRQPKLYDLVINIPPGETKSTIVTKMFPVWLWTRDPSIRIINTSYSGSLAMHHSVRSRDIIRSDKYKMLFGDIKIRADEDSKGYYKNNYGGDRLATSVGGSVTGMHGHIIIIDDPVNPKQANSFVINQSANDYIKHTLSTRKVEKELTPMILIMQRLNMDDTSNLLLQQKKTKHINLPAELSDKVKPPELKEKYVNGLLDPIRMPIEILEELKENIGSYNYSSQVAQDPSPKGGRIWQEWFVPIKRDELPPINQVDKYGTDWDLAYEKEKGKNSASAFVITGKKGNNIYIYDAGYRYLEFPELIKFMKTKPETHYIEGKASGKSAKQTLKQEGISTKEVQVSTDKVARVRDVTPKVEGGFVFVEESLLDMIYNDHRQGLLNFPNNLNDDLNDAITQAIKRHSTRRKGIIRR